MSYLIEASGSNSKFICEMITVFLKQTPDYLALLQKAILSEDWAGYRQAMHKFKPTITMMGIKLEKEIIQIENITKKLVNLELLPLLTDNVSKICTEAYKELEEEKKKLKA